MSSELSLSDLKLSNYSSNVCSYIQECVAPVVKVLLL